MSNEQIWRASEYIVDEIVKDLCSRKGLGNEFESFDKDIQEQIKEDWKEIVKDNLESY